MTHPQSTGTAGAPRADSGGPKAQPPGSVGDVNSSVKGSGARYNGGKAQFDLVPLREMHNNLDYVGTGDNGGALTALRQLGRWQETGDTDYLHEALAELGIEGWRECAEVFEYGKAKYAPWNWAKGMTWGIPLACAVRHLTAILAGEIFDPESGLAHRGHVFCNLVMLLTYTRTFPEGDDRPRTLVGDPQ